MSFDEWKDLFEIAVLAVVDKIDVSRELLRLDVGVFPWHGWIELSLLFSEEADADAELIDDIAAWPSYNFSNYTEKEWSEVQEICDSMKAMYSSDIEIAHKYFEAAAEVMKRTTILQALKNKYLSKSFKITLTHPDDHEISYL
ncbi:MAG: hypothetical protein AAFS10_16445 [Myxococcota bacterium]